MIPEDQIPDFVADFVKVDVDLPRLDPDDTVACPLPMAGILDYLSRECPDGEELRDSDLRFVRTALVDGRNYWIWAFEEPDDGTAAFVTVSTDSGTEQSTVGYDSNEFGLSAEQFILADYYEVM